MTLCDTGIIVALIVKDDRYHKQAIAAVKGVQSQLSTTWACITESMYLISHIASRNILASFIESDFLRIETLEIDDAIRACQLMRQYSDAPMDFADASLVVAAETLGITKILTFDAHFYAYRINGTIPFDVIP